ncbi:acetyl/propionyl/methylcrotonyl-CoA carboxylase subunit alpha, partial [Streptomyces sp. NPDC058548]|uniref:acetyl/propionyl/methylcrotonyl-CoA carboxylase subunit alpha n=1 Tax=Streptomyces sp. NPDC058548 TaxID=3346545 RepID=UPI00365362C0
ADAGLVFIGPPASAISLMGDKIRAKDTVKAAGVPVVPGAADPEIVEAARELGAPVLLKPSAGGGGKGMRLVRDLSTLTEEIASARREARASFGDDTLLVERWIDRPRHIEIQVLADAHGNVIHLGERECSLQRRHQKIIEEAPSVLLTPEIRASMGAAAVEAARSCGYVGAGTVEFIVPGGDPSSYYFMEMNTRLQVEHPVTELITGIDLVEWQLRVASGEPLPFAQDDIRLNGWAIEARICAEDPSRGFLPSGGTVLALNEPQGNGVRTDSGLSEGTEVSSLYDPMLSKVIVHAEDRPTALRRLRAALADTVTLGVPTNAGFLRRLLAHPDVVTGALDTGLVERDAESLIPDGVPEEVYAAAALVRNFPHPAPSRSIDQRLRRGPAGGWVDPFDSGDGWRLGGQPAWTPHHFRIPGHDPVRVRVRGNGTNAQLLLGDAELQPGTPGAAGVLAAALSGAPPAPGRVSGRGGVGEFAFHLDGVTHRFTVTPSPEGHWLGRDGDSWHVMDHDPVEAALSGVRHGGADTLAAPMPGTVTVVKVAVGDEVEAGQSLLVVEAMKMEHVISAPHAGTVTELDVTPGTTVAMDQILAVVSATGLSEGRDEPVG